MALNVQVNILSVDTGNFYYDDEAALHKLNHDKRIEKNKLINGFNERLEDGTVVHSTGTKELLSKLEEYGYSQNDIEQFVEEIPDGASEEIILLAKDYIGKSQQIKAINDEAKESKDKLLELLKSRVEKNVETQGKDHIRELNFSSFSKDGEIYPNNIISVFDSSFTRMIGAKQDCLTEDFMVVQVFYFDVIKDLIYYGFTYKGEKYIYFTSSAGQIRTKKTVFVKESIWKKYEKTIMCGLTIDSINAKGGNNPNKHLAYMALLNSATDVWDEFDIDKTIVVDDFETNVFGTYDLIDDTDYSIKRMSGYVPITHTDGVGMMLPCMGKNRMVRLPWVKGLLGAFDFVKFIQVNNCSPIIKDIYGKEHDVIAEDIQIIFTKSQFKMCKYYDSWEQYKEFYKKYNCTAGYTNMEEDRIRNATINYQMLQSLTDITDDEILDIAKDSINKLNNICSSTKSVKEFFGITPYNTNPTYFQQGIALYENLLNDEYTKKVLRDNRDSTVKRYKAGKLKIRGKYTFVIPDLYAVCEYLFMGIKNPDGLLDDKEVFCWLFRNDSKLDCLRSPHLYREHAIRNNVASKEYESKRNKLREWFTTDAIYTSCKDLISKILQFDCDGDTLLVVPDEMIIKVAERNMKGIVPLYYNMRKAAPSILNNQIIYNGLNAAFTGGNIGLYSNNISKIWNSEVFISGTDEEKQNALDIIKLLCCENNFTIDFAKTLYKPERPNYIDEKIKSFTKLNLPHFFEYAKDKAQEQVEDVNGSFVNKLDSIIPSPKINMRNIGIGKVDYRLLMHNPKIECKASFTKHGKIITEQTEPLILKYLELSKNFIYKTDANSICSVSRGVLTKSQSKQDLLFRNISKLVKQELLQFGYSESEIVDKLVHFLYKKRANENKGVLWICYGNYLVENLKKHFKETTKSIQCVDCGEWFEVDIKDTKTCKCPECYSKYRREYIKMKVREHRKSKCKQTK